MILLPAGTVASKRVRVEIEARKALWRGCLTVTRRYTSDRKQPAVASIGNGHTDRGSWNRSGINPRLDASGRSW